jgi:hypothetical protein
MHIIQDVRQDFADSIIKDFVLAILAAEHLIRVSAVIPN